MTYGKSVSLRIMTALYSAGFTTLVHADFRYYAARDIDNAIGCTITVTVMLFMLGFLILVKPAP